MAATTANNQTPAASGAQAGSGDNTPLMYSQTSLYVGDLPTDITEAMLFEIFSQVGSVASIRVCRDTVTRRSLGYAYVNFHNATDAERALDTMNYTVIRGSNSNHSKPCRIMWSHRDPAIRKSGLGNVFVKNLAKNIDSKALYDTFSAFGNILSCKIACDEKGESRGFGFVHYETQEAAELAIQKVNGMLMNEKKVFVGLHQKRAERGDAGYEKKFTNVYVKNLDENVTEEELKKIFDAHGTVTSAVIMRDHDGKSRGFGFVNFDKFDQAANAVDAMNGATVKGKEIFCGRAQKKVEREHELRKKFEDLRQERVSKYQGVNLFIKNLDDTVDDERLRLEFSSFGTITSAKVMRDDKGASRGFGFVCFDQNQPEAATKAVTDMNGKMIAGKPVFVALAQRKEVRRAQLEAQHQQRMANSRMMRVDQNALNPGMYGAGAPVFYQPNVGGPQRQGFMYPQQMVHRPRWQQPGPNQSGVPNYMVPVAGRQQRRQQRGGPQGQPGAMQGNRQMGVSGGNRRNMGKFPPNSNRRDQEPLTASVLAAASPPQQKQMLGERLFPLVQAQLEKNNNAPMAGKITGMLLEMDNAELLILLDSQDSLVEKVDEAFRVLQEHADANDNAETEEA